MHFKPWCCELATVISNEIIPSKIFKSWKSNYSKWRLFLFQEPALEILKTETSNQSCPPVLPPTKTKKDHGKVSIGQWRDRMNEFE